MSKCPQISSIPQNQLDGNTWYLYDLLGDNLVLNEMWHQKPKIKKKIRKCSYFKRFPHFLRGKCSINEFFGVFEVFIKSFLPH